MWLGGEQNRPAPKDDPCSIFSLGVDLVLVFLRGAGLVISFLRDEGVVGSVFYLEKRHYPFDLQVGSLLGTQGGS